MSRTGMCKTLCVLWHYENNLCAMPISNAPHACEGTSNALKVSTHAEIWGKIIVQCSVALLMSELNTIKSNE